MLPSNLVSVLNMCKLEQELLNVLAIYELLLGALYCIV
jgi:hypothetical protein